MAGTRLQALRRPKVWVPVFVLIMAAAGGGYWFWLRPTPTAAAATTSQTSWVAAAATTMQKSISTTGTLTPKVQQAVNFAGAGTVTAVSVKVGDTVTVGQSLATIDTLTLNANLLSAKATLATAQAKLTSDTDNMASDAQLAADQAAITLAQSKVDDATAAMNGATLTAPVDGLVTAVNLTIGQKVTGSSGGSGASGSSTGSTSTTQIQITGTTSWTTTVSVDDSQVGLLKAGNQAQLAITGTQTPVFGTVASVGLISTSTGNTAAYPVVVDVTGSPTGLHDGTAVTVTLIYERRTNVLAVPAAAVHTENGAVYVLKNVDGAAVKTTVTAGETSSGATEITAGVAEGDQVQVTVTTGTGTGNTGSTTVPNRTSNRQNGNFGNFTGNGGNVGGNGGGNVGGNVPNGAPARAGG